ncbi:MAG: hypothetical protein JKX82_07880, partial [Oleispira sp.]|nr:hypothetical protein [Oleispira sp.]
MAKRIFSQDNYIVVDPDNGSRKLHLPKGTSIFINKTDRFTISAHLRGGGGGDSLDVLFTNVGDWFDESGLTAFTEETLRDFLVKNTGFSAAGTAALSTGRFIFVGAKYNLPFPVNGVITLLPLTAYLFISDIDLEGDRIVCSQSTAILGSTSETASITSTG